MNERNGRRAGGAGAPFYAPPRRKTSAEIISEARAAVYGEMSAASSGSSGAAGALRPLRTRRPFTPREPQRTLFAERARKKDSRPPSAFDLKSLSVQENPFDAGMMAKISATLEEERCNGVFGEPLNAKKKPSVIHKPARSMQERPTDIWTGLPKLPHLNGRSKPLHRRNTTGHGPDDLKLSQNDLANSICVIQPLGNHRESSAITNELVTKSLSPEVGKRRRNFGASKSVSCETNAFRDIAVRHLEVQLPNTSCGEYDNMSLLELSERLSRRSHDPDEVIYMLDAMQSILEANQPANSMRELVLRALYTHIDHDDERVLVAIAKAMLTIRVTGKHLAAACKLVFKIARNDKNDHFFKNCNLLELLVEGCGRADPLSEAECCVYGAGALRFLALEPRLCALAHHAGALHLAALHLKILNNAKAENPRGVSEQSTHALYQLTGALRNLAGAGPRDVRAFVASGALAELLAALRVHTDRDVLTNVARCLRLVTTDSPLNRTGSGPRDVQAFVASGALAELLAALRVHTDRDVLTNVARCLSVLSAEESCCAWLCASAESACTLLRALRACCARAPLAVRLAYALGNMAAHDEQARLNIYEEEGGVDVLLTILESYTKRNDSRDETDPDLHLVDVGGSDGSNVDVLIKTVRVVANLCLAERAGRGLAEVHAERTIKALLACLSLAEKLSKMPRTKPAKEDSSGWMERHEELATAALATLNNITFYRETPDPLDDTLDLLCKVTCTWLDSDSGAAACEAVRALGNLSRAPSAAQRIVVEGGVDKLAPFLQHDESHVRCAAAGVLVNVCGAGAAGASAAADAAAALAAAAAASDAAAAALLARALWNAHAHRPLDAAVAHQAATALTLFIDDESVFDPCEATSRLDRRSSEPGLSKCLRVKFDIDNNNLSDDSDKDSPKPFTKALSVDQNLHLGDHYGDDDGEHTGCSGEDLGFEDGEVGYEECHCKPCTRLAAWEELVGVAIPLLEKLRFNRADASVGTD